MYNIKRTNSNARRKSGTTRRIILVKSRLVLILIRSRDVVGGIQIKEVDWFQRNHHLLSWHDGKIYKQ